MIQRFIIIHSLHRSYLLLSVTWLLHFYLLKLLKLLNIRLQCHTVQSTRLRIEVSYKIILLIILRPNDSSFVKIFIIIFRSFV